MKMKKERKMKKKYEGKILKYVFLVVAIIIALELLFMFFSGSPIKFKKLIVQEEDRFFNIGESTLVSLKLPAVDSKGKGVSTFLNVEATKGTGKTLVNIEDLLFWADTQHSIRMARLVADKFSNNSVDDYDFVYSVEANASIIGGPSAGAAITIATIFALNHEEPRDDVMITGTINHDGSIGPVSVILEKAKASKQAGASLFLVPLLQSRDVIYETRQHCEKFGFTEICQQETIPIKIDVAEEAGIEIIEVANIEEALKYFS